MKIFLGVLAITIVLLAQSQAQTAAFVTVASPNYAAYSTDGINWSASTLPNSGSWQGVAYGNGTFVAAAWGTNYAAYSANGINWTASTMPSSDSWYGMAYGGGTFVALAVGDNHAAYSTNNGINWIASTLPSSDDWQDVVYGNGIFVAIVHGDSHAAYSTNGINWSAATLPSSANWQWLAYGNGVFVTVVGGSSVGAYSTNGINWTVTTLPGDNWASVSYGNGVFVAVAWNSGQAAYSTNGINWTATSMPSTAPWYNSTYATDVNGTNGAFVAVSINSSAAAYSTNGINWTASPGLPNSAYWWGIAGRQGPAPSTATATATVVNGFVVGAPLSNGGYGYTNTPLVSIVGGGGTGATATAVVSNGMVVGITINDAGSGYTSTPIVYIYTPFYIASQPQSVAVHAHGSASFSVTPNVTGLPASYQWSLNSTNIPGATSSNLTISNVMQTNLGTYAVVVTNLFYSVPSSPATLSMYPYITTPFTGALTYWGKDATLSIQAWGTGPLSYQWFDNGNPLDGATNQTLTLDSIQFTNGGLYSVVVSNALGSATNTPEQVVVEPAGVSLGIYPGVTINGVTGYSYIIQSTTNLSNSNSWATVANLTLTQPVQIWVDTNTDTSLPTNPRRYYQVLPGQ